MIKAIGVIETTSISLGIDIADTMLKTSTVQLLESKSICPGKYMSIIYGDVESVENSIKVGKEKAKGFYVDDVVIPNVHHLVVPAIIGVPSPSNIEAIGILEFFSVTGAVYAADAAVKAADVSIVNMRLGFAIGGKSFVILTGDVGAIKEAVNFGIQGAKDKGLLFNYNIIPSPHKSLIEKLI